MALTVGELMAEIHLESDVEMVLAQAQAHLAAFAEGFSLLPDRAQRAFEGLAAGLRDQGEGVARAVGEIADRAAERALSRRGAFLAAGLNLSAGLTQGIEAGRSAVVAAAAATAQAAAQAARAALEIHSPSRVMERIGLLGDEGLARGFADGRELVARAANQVSEAATEAARIAVEPTSQSSPVAIPGPSIDYERLAAAIAARPAVFDVNGKQIATATVTDNSEALASRNRRLLAGVGSV